MIFGPDQEAAAFDLKEIKALVGPKRQPADPAAAFNSVVKRGCCFDGCRHRGRLRSKKAGPGVLEDTNLKSAR